MAQSVARIAKFAEIRDRNLTPGESFLVEPIGQHFDYHPTSSKTVDNITSIATRSGIGRFLRRLDHVPMWTETPTWHIKASGNDETGDGSETKPLRTVAEAFRRLRVLKASGGYVLNCYDDIASTDSICPSPILDDSTPHTSGQCVILRGVATVQHTSTTTSASSASDITTNPVQTTLIDNTVTDFTRFIGMQVVTATGLIATILSAPSAGVARVSEWALLNADPTAAPTAGTPPGSGVAYTIYARPKIRCLIDYAGQAGGQLAIDNFHIPSSAPAWRCRIGTLVFSRCQIDKAPAVHNVGFGKVLYHGCSIKNWGTVPGLNSGEFFFVGCGIIGSTFGTQSGGYLRYNFSTFQNSIVKNTSGGASTGHTGGASLQFLGKCGFWDWTGVAITLDRGGLCTVMGDLYGTTATAATGGVAVNGGAQMHVLSTKTPTIKSTGSGDSYNLRIDGEATHLPDLRASAGGSLPALASCISFAEWVSNFSRNVRGTKSGAAVLDAA